MGREYFVTSGKGDSDSPTKAAIQPGTDFNIPPGQFAFLISEEDVSIPHYAMAFISMRTGLKFQGLVNVSGFHVDPGYKGKLIFAVFNASPTTVQLSGGELLFKIWFVSIDRHSERAFDKPPIQRINKDLMRGMTRELLSLQQLNDKIRDVETSVNNRLGAFQPTIDNLQFVWRAVTLAVVGAVVISILAIAWPTLKSVAQWLEHRVSTRLASPPTTSVSPQTTNKPQ